MRKGMDFEYLAYTVLCIFAFITVVYFWNTASFLKKEKVRHEKIWALSPITRLLYLILTWLICALCMFIAYQHGLRGLSIRAMLPFCLIWLFLVGLPIREYLRKKISTLKAGEYLNILNLLLLIVFQVLSVFIMGSAILLVKILV